ncbi:MAG: hypothetical protein WBK28_02170 [Minisyncoccia bacterium]
MTSTLSVQESFSFGWRTFKARPWIFVQAALVLIAISIVFNILGSLLGAGAEADGGIALISVLLSLVLAVASLYVSITVNNMGFMSFYLKAHDALSSVSLRDLWRPHPFWKFVLAIITLGVTVLVGLILLIVPGVIFSLMFFPTLYIVLERELGPIEAMKEAARMTKGNRWKLLLFGFAVLGINLVGALVLLVGLLVSIPVSMLATIHVYRTLANHTAVAPVTPPAAA